MSVITSIMVVRPRLAGDLVDERVEDFENAVGDCDEQVHHDTSPRRDLEVTQTDTRIAARRRHAGYGAEPARWKPLCNSRAGGSAPVFVTVPVAGTSRSIA